MSPMTPTFHNAYYTDDFFFQSLKMTCHRKALGSNSHVEVRFPSFPTLI